MMTHADTLALDIAILGAGPAGLAAACTCRELGLRYAVFDNKGLAQSFVEYPSALRFFSPPDEMEVGGIPFPVAGGHKPTREDYLAYLRAVPRARDLALHTWESIASVEQTANGYVLSTRQEPCGTPGRTATSRAIVLATGVWAVPNSLDVPGADGPNVLSEFFDPTPYYGRRVLVVGSGNSGVGAALSLMEARAEVALCTRRPPKAYRCGLRPFVKRDLDFAVDEGKVALHDGTIVTKITPCAATLKPVRYTGEEDLTEGTMADYESAGEEYDIPCRFVFALLGHRPDERFLHQTMGLGLRPDGRPTVDRTTWETERKNIFLVGSLADRSIDIVLKSRAQAAEVIRRIAERL